MGFHKNNLPAVRRAGSVTTLVVWSGSIGWLGREVSVFIYIGQHFCPIVMAFVLFAFLLFLQLLFSFLSLFSFPLSFVPGFCHSKSPFFPFIVQKTFPISLGVFS